MSLLETLPATVLVTLLATHTLLAAIALFLPLPPVQADPYILSLITYTPQARTPVS